MGKGLKFVYKSFSQALMAIIMELSTDYPEISPKHVLPILQSPL